MKTTPKHPLPALPTIPTLLTLLALALPAPASDGFNLWATGKIEKKILPWAKVELQQELWYDSDRLYKENTLLNATLKLTDFLSVAPGFRYETTQKQGDWTGEYRPTLDLLFSHSIHGWKLDDRLRFELRDRDDVSRLYMRYRNRLRIRAPWQWTEYRITPFAYWESFFDHKPGVDSSDVWNRNRFAAGLSAKITPNLSASIFYMHQSAKSNESWRPTHCPSLEIKYSF